MIWMSSALMSFFSEKYHPFRGGQPVKIAINAGQIKFLQW